MNKNYEFRARCLNSGCRGVSGHGGGGGLLLLSGGSLGRVSALRAQIRLHSAAATAAKSREGERGKREQSVVAGEVQDQPAEQEARRHAELTAAHAQPDPRGGGEIDYSSQVCHVQSAQSVGYMDLC